MVKALFDTNILIDYLNGVKDARRVCHEHSGRAISIVSWMEVMAGSTPADEAGTRTFLRQFVLIPLSEAIAEQAVILRRATRLKLPDAIILATAQHEGRMLITRNTKDFPAGTPGVITPYAI